MKSLRNVLFTKLKAPLMSSRLLSGSEDKGDSKNSETKDVKKPQRDICGNKILPTAPRCKNKPGGDDKSKDKKP